MSGAQTELLRRCRGPLLAYVEASSLWRLGDAAATVDGFLARFPGGSELPWRASGLPFRRWLVNELLAYARGLAEGAPSPCGACGCGASCMGAAAKEGSLEPRAFGAFEQAWARSTLAAAREVVRRELIDARDGDAWEAFRLHAFERRETAEIAAALGIDRGEVRLRVRRAEERFDRSLRALLADEGFTDEGFTDEGSTDGRAEDPCVDDEIAWLLEAAAR